MKNIVFDIGNVLADWDWKGYLNSLFTDEAVKKSINRGFYGNELWQEMDRGAISQDTIHKELLKIAAEDGYEAEMEIAYTRIGECITRFPYAKEWVTDLKQEGYKVYFLSNYSKYLIAKNPEALDFTKLMDGGIYSCDVKLLKPDLSIYALLCSRYDLKPGECLFIDDKRINVVAAKEFGMHALRFQGYETTRALAEDYLKTH